MDPPSTFRKCYEKYLFLYCASWDWVYFIFSSLARHSPCRTGPALAKLGRQPVSRGHVPAELRTARTITDVTTHSRSYDTGVGVSLATPCTAAIACL